ncbi:hypothetical protein MACK_001524 [Theileria orientalis]|uniref:Uncharacterized protein n=1 Tax=Theileria orientalis TaxID=68886 RepID=A0A976QUS8_THEOR|nr:hypothetical protein MACK_001524 [Theileria orientalis]
MINRSNSNIETSSPLISTHPKTNHQEKNTQPLRFRSFDAFYQEYNRKNSPGDSKNLNPANKTPIKNTSVKDKIELLKASKNKESVASKSDLVQPSDYYNIKGRVKKLCEKFQKCDGHTQFCSGLRSAIAKAKIQKSSKPPASLLSSSVQTESAEIQPIDVLSAIETHVKLAGSKDAHKLASPTVSNDTKQFTNSELHKLVDTNAGPLGDLSPLIAKPGSSTGLDEAAINTVLIGKNSTKDSVIVEKNPGTSSPSAPSPARSASFKYASPTKPAVITRSASSGERPSGEKPISVTSTHWIYSKSLSQTKTTLNTPRTELVKYGPLTCGMAPQDIDIGKYSLKNSQSTTEDSLSPGLSESESLPRQNSNTSLKSEDEALIDQVIDRIMDDRDFCNAFFDKLEALNLGSKSESLQFDTMIDDLQFLLDEDDEPETEVSEETKKAFDWFFNQPQVFDLEFTERNDRNLVTTIEESDSSESASLIGDEPPSKTSLKEEPPEPSNKTESFNWLSLYNHTRNPASTGYDVASNLNNSYMTNSFRDNSIPGGYKSDLFKNFDWFNFLG